MIIAHLLALSVLVDDPLAQRVSPVLDEEALSVLLALPVPEPALSLRPRDQVRFGQIYFQIFPHLAADLCLRTPGAPIQLLPYPETDVNVLK